MMSVNITSVDDKIYYSIICKNTDKFIKLEEQFYKDFPEYTESENFFLFKGIKINKYKSLKENNINHNDIVVLDSLGFV